MRDGTEATAMLEGRDLKVLLGERPVVVRLKESFAGSLAGKKLKVHIIGGRARLTADGMDQGNLHLEHAHKRKVG